MCALAAFVLDLPLEPRQLLPDNLAIVLMASSK
jgi:hypothetical protein